QALFFADGGITALGTNVVLMGVLTVAAGWLVFRLALRLLPARRSSTVPASFVAALVSVPVSALGFVALYAVGGTADISLAALATAMLGWHALIGVGEAFITAATVATVLAYGARTFLPGQDLTIRTGPVVSKGVSS